MQFKLKNPTLFCEYFVKFKLFKPLTAFIERLWTLLEGCAPVDLPECLFPDILDDLSNPASIK